MLRGIKLLKNCGIYPLTNHTQFKNTFKNNTNVLLIRKKSDNFVFSPFPSKTICTNNNNNNNNDNHHHNNNNSSSSNDNNNNPAQKKISSPLYIYGIISLVITSFTSSALCENESSSVISSPSTTTSSTSSSSSICTPSRYIFDWSAGVIPHPEKAHKGGEDAYFVSDDRTAIGVADGVGGWSKRGVDPALYARALMEGAKVAANKKDVQKSPVKLMWAGYQAAMNIKGSSTCCIVLMNDGNLLSANLGDSGFMVVREDKIIYRTKEQQHSFNFPFQLGGNTSKSSDNPDHSDQNTLLVKSDDVVILGTDGLWDNLYDDQILQLVKKTHVPSQLANLIAQNASVIANKSDCDTPFSDGYLKYSKKRRPGGKLDDITVLVGVIKCGDSDKLTEGTKPTVNVLSRLWAKL